MATHVVTAFLRNDATVLLLRRSDAVGSYQGQWGGVAGHIETTPPDRDAVASAALTEIEEETGLADAVTLVRCGAPFSVVDAALDTEWVVHPCLYDCPDRAVTPNEETTAWEWVQPPTILDRDTVPALWQSYTAVAPSVESIRTDTTHGSATLSIRALEVLRDHSAVAARRDTEIDLPDLAHALLESRPGMAAVTNRLNRVMAAADRADATADPATIEDLAIQEIEAAVAADDRAAATATDHLADRVVTISASGTVETALRAATVPVLVAEARPGGEGHSLAARLADGDRPVTLAPDATIPGCIEGTDTVLVGADTVLPDGSVHNKVGTYPLALAADRVDADCYAVCATDKIAPDAQVSTPDAPADTLDAPPGVAVTNPLLETTPATLFDGIITESGVLAPSEIDALAEDLAALGTWRD
ncbi:MAG: NUDIX domain-containing protein [Halobacteriaceae archaeon]